MNEVAPVVFLLDVDNTLLDNDSVVADLKKHLEDVIGADCGPGYWGVFERLRKEMGYADYLGALQLYRTEAPEDADFWKVSSYLLNYPFVSRLYPGVLDLLRHLEQFGPTVILTDGDVVFQPWKIMRSGLWDAVSGRVLIYVHKEEHLSTVEAKFPAKRYVLVDDKLRLLHAIKQIWGDRLTTVFPRQGHYAHDPAVLSAYPAADIAVDHVSDLLQYDLSGTQSP